MLEALFEVFANTMSVHLRENQAPLAKHGAPGRWVLEPLNDKILSKQRLLDLADFILDSADDETSNSFLEEDEEFVQVVQLKDYRIVICYPPFSDAHEITIVRPTMQKDLDSYDLPTKLLNRLQSRAEGILIAGAPGHGKSTFTSALANFYADQNKIIKTIEKPRDLQVDERITQFTNPFSNFEKVGDVLLLMRPDYVIFDEIRKNEDFALYSDMRLAGVGMVGVIHSTQPIDAVQRFVNRIELGQIPSIIDTIIFIKNGFIEEVLQLIMTVKTPYGFRDQSLARPVIEVKDFMTKSLLYEIFSFGEQIVVIPIPVKNKSKKKKHTSKKKKSKLPLNKILYDLTVAYPDLDFPTTCLSQEDIDLVQLRLPRFIVDKLVNDQNRILSKLEERYGIFIDLVTI